MANPIDSERAQYRALLEALPHGVQRNDLSGTITYSNAAHARMHGYEEGELLGKKIWDLLASDSERRRLREFLARLVAGQPDPEPYFATDRTKQGGTIDVQVDWVYDRDAAGRLIGFTSVITDITERARWERELQASRQMLRLVLDAIPVRVFWKDLDSIYLGCNRPFAKDAGLESPEQIVGKHDRELSWRQQAELYRADDEKVMRSGEPKLNYEESQTRPDGTKLVLRTRKLPLRDVEGNVVGLLGCYEDITQERELESRLRQSQKMEALGQLAGGVAHDFNNLLTAILGYVELELAGPGADAGRTRRNLGEVRSAAEQGASLTRQLLAFTRQQVLEPRALDLNEVVRETESLLRRTIGEDIELCTRLDPDLGRIRADRGQLKQILLNLAVNARDAMPEGGSLDIETSNATMPEPGVPEREYIRLRVTDTGCGMDEQTVSRAFEPFFTTKEKTRGTGLGLSTVYGVVKQNGGDIRLDSAPGRGTSFEIYMPQVRQQPRSDRRPVLLQRAPGGDEVVLLVEDDDAVRGMARRALEQGGYRVLEAAAPAEALERCARHDGPIHVLVTDLVLPGMNGVDLIEKVRDARPDTAVLTVSGYTDRPTLDGEPFGSCFPFLPKPFLAAELLHRIRQILDAR